MRLEAKAITTTCSRWTRRARRPPERKQTMTLTPEEQAAADAKAADETTAADETAKAAETAAAAASGDDTFSAEYVKGLREEAAKFRKEKNDAADKLKAREDAELSDSEKAKKEAKEATERADKAEHKLLRTEVAAKKKLSPAVAERLKGDTKEELEKDADKLLKDLGSGAAAGGGFDQGAGRGPASKGTGGWLNKAIAGDRKSVV